MFPNPPGWSGLILSACAQNTKALQAQTHPKGSLQVSRRFKTYAGAGYPITDSLTRIKYSLNLAISNL